MESDENFISITIENKKFSSCSAKDKISKIVRLATKNLSFSSKYIYICYNKSIFNPGKSLADYGFLNTPPDPFTIYQSDEDMFSKSEKPVKVLIRRENKKAFESDLVFGTTIFELKQMIENHTKIKHFQLTFGDEEAINNHHILSDFIDPEDDEELPRLIFEMIMIEDIFINIKAHINNNECFIFEKIFLIWDFNIFLEMVEKQLNINIKEYDIFFESKNIKCVEKIIKIFEDIKFFPKNIDLYLVDTSKMIILCFNFDGHFGNIYLTLDSKPSESLELISSKMKIDESKTICNMTYKGSLIPFDKSWNNVNLSQFSVIILSILTKKSSMLDNIASSKKNLFPDIPDEPIMFSIYFTIIKKKEIFLKVKGNLNMSVLNLKKKIVQTEELFNDIPSDSFSLFYNEKEINDEEVIKLILDSNKQNLEMLLVMHFKENLKVKFSFISFEKNEENQEYSLKIHKLFKVNPLKHFLCHQIKAIPDNLSFVLCKEKKIIELNDNENFSSFKEKTINVSCYKIYRIKIYFQESTYKIKSHLNISVEKLIKIKINESLENACVKYENTKLEMTKKLSEYASLLNLSKTIDLTLKVADLRDIMIKAPCSGLESINKTFKAETQFKKIMTYVQKKMVPSDQIKKFRLFFKDKEISEETKIIEFDEKSLILKVEISKEFSLVDFFSKEKTNKIVITNFQQIQTICSNISEIVKIKEKLILLDQDEKEIKKVKSIFKKLENHIFYDVLCEVYILYQKKEILKMSVPRSTKIIILKKTISEKLQNFDFERQELFLFCSGDYEKLEDKKTRIGDILISKMLSNLTFHIKDFKTLTLLVGQSTKMQLKTYENMKLKYQKDALSRLINVEPERQLWIFDDSEMKDENKELEDYELRKKINSEIIFVKIKFQLNLCYNDKVYEMKEVISTEKIINLQEKLKISLGFSISEQSWIYNESSLALQNTLEDSKLPLDKAIIPIDLEIKPDLQYFGFNDKLNNISNDIFKYFFLETDDTLKEVISNLSLNNVDDYTGIAFRNNIMPIFFNAIKKHSLWDEIIEKIRKNVMEEYGIKIWSTQETKNKFNSAFLLYYFLGSGIKDLINPILKLMKKHCPLPLYIFSWDSLASSIEKPILFDDLFWNFAEGFIIVSIGTGSHIQGKSNLLNHIFDTSFLLNDEKHRICSGVPEISFDLFKNSKYSMHLIDMPINFENNEDIEKFINYCDLLIIHCNIEDKKEIEKYKKKYQKKPILYFYRDDEQGLCNFGQQSKIKQPKNSCELAFHLPCLHNKAKHYQSELDIIRDKCQCFIFNHFDKYEKNEKKNVCKFFLMYDQTKRKFASFLKSLENINAKTELKYADQIYELLKNLEAKYDDNLSENMLKIINFAFDSNNKVDIIRLQKIAETLKVLKEQKNHKFYALYNYKILLESSQENKENIKNFKNYWNNIRSHSSMKDLVLKENSTVEETSRLIEEAILRFETQIIPESFSLELFWREAIYFNHTHPNYFLKRKDENISLEMVLIEIMKASILNGLPFEIIDGDLLYLAGDFYKKVFKGLGQKVIVVSIIGPQSSGKSTLLNFLFGCDFNASEGRCTKGVYGTYFPISNLNNCEGIFLLDTEGLFSVSNSKENKNRKNFDNKLVLFCFGVSDFVIVNSKGDISSSTQDIINVCLNSLLTMEQGNENLAEIILCLNQNNDSLKNHYQEINNIFGQFIETLPLENRDKIIEKIGINKNNVFNLSNAFDIITNDVQANDEVIRVNKKSPRSVFIKDCRVMCQKIFSKLRLKETSKLKSLESTIERMDLIWNIVNKFDNLTHFSKISNMKHENLMTKWTEEFVTKEKNEHFFNDLFSEKQEFLDNQKILLGFNRIASDIRDNIINEFKKEFINLEQQVKENFIEETLEKKINILISEFQDLMNNHFTQRKIKHSLNDGEESINSLIRQINRSKIENEFDKVTLFEQEYDAQIAKMKTGINREKMAKNLYDSIRDAYRNSVNGKIHLPNDSMECNTNESYSYSEYENKILETLRKSCGKEQTFQYNDRYPVYVFDNGHGLSNITFSYFDLRKYYKLEKKTQYHLIYRKNLQDIINFEKIFYEHKAFIDNPKKHIFKEIFELLNKDLKYNIGLSLNYSYFEDKLNDMTKNKFMKFASWIISSFGDSKKQTERLYQSSDILIEKAPIYHHAEFFLIDKLYYMINQYNYLSKITKPHFLRNIFDYGINWQYIIQYFITELDKMLKIGLYENLLKKINDELVLINLFCNIYSPKLKEMLLDSEYEKFKENFANSIITNKIQLEKTLTLPNELNYIKMPKVLECITLGNSYSFNYDNKNFLLINVTDKESYLVENDFSDIKWLDHYGNQTNKNLLTQNTYENSQLKEFVFSQFNFNKFYSNILKSLQEYLSKKTFYEKNICPEIYNLINSIISETNNDLQQVSFKLTFKFVGYIHFSAIQLIWKHFEEIKWKKSYKPIDDCIKMKDKHLNYFKAATSNDQNEKIKKEAAALKDNILLIFGQYSAALKKELTCKTIENFKNISSREYIQNYIDSSYFSTNSKKSIEEIYMYITNPFKIIDEECKNIYKREKENLKQAFLLDKNIINKLILMKERMEIMQKKILVIFKDACDCNLLNLFSFQNKENKETEKLPFLMFSDDLSVVLYQYLMKIIIKGEKSNRIFFLENNYEAHLNNSFAEIDFGLNNPNFPNCFDQLAFSRKKVFNPLQFLGYLLTDLDDIIKNNETLFPNFKDQDEELIIFESEIKIPICKEKCPCCHRLCGVGVAEDHVHKCIYGHQMRAIGGIILTNGEASISRCEDIGDIDKIKFLGNEITWIEFKNYWKKHENTKWSFDDIANTKYDKKLRDRFQLAWDLVGKKVCESYKGVNMKFVQYNQENIEKQIKNRPIAPNHYIFMIDSSGSMQGKSWEELKDSLKEIIEKMIESSPNHIVSIVNFSSKAFCEVKMKNPSSINIQSLSFFGHETDFGAAFTETIKLIREDLKQGNKHNLRIVFMTDGYSNYPLAQIDEIKSLLSDKNFKESKKNFKFFGLIYQNKNNSFLGLFSRKKQNESEIFDKIVSELNGEKRFATDGDELKSRYMEIFTNSLT